MNLLDEFLELPQTKRAVLSVGPERESHSPNILMLPEVVPFDVQNVADYTITYVEKWNATHRPGGSRRTEEVLRTIPRLVPPFPSQWFEFSVDREVYGVHAITLDLWAQQSEDSTTAGLEILRTHLNRGQIAIKDLRVSETRWVVRMVAYARQAGRVLAYPDGMLVLVAPDGLAAHRPRPTGDTAPAMCLFPSESGDWDDLPAEERIRRAGSLDGPFFVAMMATGFTHCKNVSMIDVLEPPLSVRAKREKKLKRPESRFRMLAIDPMRVDRDRTTGAADGEDNDPTGRSLHIARGHFATYTDDKPLFGRYVGTFWRPAHVRGHIRDGVVSKHYGVRSTTPDASQPD